MSGIDNRELYKDRMWRTGRLLITTQTRHWSQQRRDEADAIERRSIFAGFTPEDEGRSRLFVYQCDTVEEARSMVEEHNANVCKRPEENYVEV